MILPSLSHDSHTRRPLQVASKIKSRSASIPHSAEQTRIASARLPTLDVFLTVKSFVKSFRVILILGFRGRKSFLNLVS
jgi:hypothetical protein